MSIRIMSMRVIVVRRLMVMRFVVMRRVLMWFLPTRISAVRLVVEPTHHIGDLVLWRIKPRIEEGGAVRCPVCRDEEWGRGIEAP